MSKKTIINNFYEFLNVEKLDENNLEEKSKYNCFYCEKVILEDEIQIQ